MKNEDDLERCDRWVLVRAMHRLLVTNDQHRRRHRRRRREENLTIILPISDHLFSSSDEQDFVRYRNGQEKSENSLLISFSGNQHAERANSANRCR